MDLRDARFDARRCTAFALSLGLVNYTLLY